MWRESFLIRLFGVILAWPNPRSLDSKARQCFVNKKIQAAGYYKQHQGTPNQN